MKIKTVDFSELHKMVAERPKEWRKGQAYFNYAYQLYPDETETLRSTDVDCFYLDRRIPDFLDALTKQITNK